MQNNKSSPLLTHCWAHAAGGAQLGTLVLQGNSTLPQAGRDISPLTLSVENLDRSILRIKLGAPGRWEVPAAQLFTSTAQGECQNRQHASLESLYFEANMQVLA